MNGAEVSRNSLHGVLTVSVNDVGGRNRYGKRVRWLAEVTLKETRERERTSHHSPGGRKRRIARIHVAEVDLAFVCYGRPA
jgi:hypothetical protein